MLSKTEDPCIPFRDYKAAGVASACALFGFGLPDVAAAQKDAPLNVFSASNSTLVAVFPSLTSADAEEVMEMKRTIAGVLLLLGLSVGTVFADDAWRDRRDIRHDEAKIAHDRRELRRDLYYGDFRAARHERKELRREYRDVQHDRRDLYWDRR